MSDQSAHAPWVHLQRALGLVPLALFAGFHVWVQWPALHGREAWIARVQAYGMGRALGWCTIAVLLLHAGLGVLRSFESRGQRSSGDRLQALSGLLVGLFVIYHLTQVWPPPDGVHATLEGSYQRLWAQLGRPAILGAYVLGCGALTCHLAHGLWRWLDARLTGALRLPLQLLVGFSGFLLFVSYLQVIARFAAGEALLPTLGPEAEQAALADDARAALPLHSPHVSHARGVGQHLP